MEQRRAPRYRMQLRLLIIQIGAEKVNRVEETRDISSGGVCFLSREQVEVGGRIEYLITLSGSNPPVIIRCLGKVLRSRKQDDSGASFEVAVTMERYQFMHSQDAEMAAAS